jgi:hypothetical protein
MEVIAEKRIKIITRVTGIMERRTGIDRRSRKFPPLKYLFLGGRRKVIRRSEDKNNWNYPDQYTFRMFLIIAFIVILSLIDGFLTLHLADYGAKETNPVMAIFLKYGIYQFLFAKLSLTFFGLICLLILNNFYLKSLRIYVKNLFPIFAGLYSVVIIWQIYIKFY